MIRLLEGIFRNVAKKPIVGALFSIKKRRTQFIGSVLMHYAGAKSVLISIGPEGGFTDDELELASLSKFIPISLGPRRLRSETAAISALSWVVGGW